MTNNKLIVPNAEFAIQQMKQEIANELGITLGATTSARDNGKVGAEMTKRVVELGQQSLMNMNPNQTTEQENHLH